MLKFNVLIESGTIGYEELKKKIEEAVKALNKLDKEGMEKFKETFKEGIKSMGDIFETWAGWLLKLFDGLVTKFMNLSPLARPTPRSLQYLFYLT